MGPTILIIDGDHEVRGFVHERVTQLLPSCRCLEAVDATQGLAVAVRHRPNVVLMAAAVPEMDGAQATRRIRAAVPQTNVVVLATLDSPQSRADAVAAGAIGYVCKHRTTVELGPLLRGLLAAGSHGSRRAGSVESDSATGWQAHPRPRSPT